MVSILHFRRRLDVPPVALAAPEIRVRNFEMPDDAPAWLALRERAMADQLPAARPWSLAVFHREMLSKNWWRPDRMWVAISADEQMVGSVTLALREGSGGTVPVVHWLVVDPAWRCRGIGRALMAHLERAVWDAGWREVELETHAGWTAAVAFYQSIGYAPVRERSPR
jgi:GNAT superfamily N-acetyltransferase